MASQTGFQLVVLDKTSESQLAHHLVHEIAQVMVRRRVPLKARKS